MTSVAFDILRFTFISTASLFLFSSLPRERGDAKVSLYYGPDELPR